jgi:hypothetical protein
MDWSDSLTLTLSQKEREPDGIGNRRGGGIENEWAPRSG